jgi:uncharacterized damage-inducible protein DinB
MRDKVKLLTEKIEKVYNGNPWYGNSIKSVLNDIDPKIAFTKAARNVHTIAELVVHIIAWREFVISKIKSDNDFKITQKLSFDWKRIDRNEKTAWKSLLNALEKNQHEILTTLKKLDDDFLKLPVSRRRYNVEFLIEGGIQHDIYHLGQISLLKKMIKGNKKLYK